MADIRNHLMKQNNEIIKHIPMNTVPISFIQYSDSAFFPLEEILNSKNTAIKQAGIAIPHSIKTSLIYPTKTLSFARTSANTAVVTLPFLTAPRLRQSRLLTWSDKITLASPFLTSKG